MLATSFFVAFGVLWLMTLIDERTRRKAMGFMAQPDNSIAFLFDNETLVNATESARHFLSEAPVGATDWARLLALLSPRFPDLPDRIAGLVEQSKIMLHSLEHFTATRNREGFP